MKRRRIESAVVMMTMFAALWVAPYCSANPQPVLQEKESEIPFPEVPRITAEELKQLMDKGSPLVLVDTRDSTSYDAGHLKGAVNIYYDPAGDPQDREMTLVALPMDKLIVIYCPCQNEEDSAPMVAQMWKLGYDHDKVKALKGGSLRWEALNYPLVKTAE